MCVEPAGCTSPPLNTLRPCTHLWQALLKEVQLCARFRACPCIVRLLGACMGQGHAAGGQGAVRGATHTRHTAGSGTDISVVDAAEGLGGAGATAAGQQHGSGAQYAPLPPLAPAAARASSSSSSRPRGPTHQSPLPLPPPPYRCHSALPPEQQWEPAHALPPPRRSCSFAAIQELNAQGAQGSSSPGLFEHGLRPPFLLSPPSSASSQDQFVSCCGSRDVSGYAGSHSSRAASLWGLEAEGAGGNCTGALQQGQGKQGQGEQQGQQLSVQHPPLPALPSATAHLDRGGSRRGSDGSGSDGNRRSFHSVSTAAAVQRRMVWHALGLWRGARPVRCSVLAVAQGRALACLPLVQPRAQWRPACCAARAPALGSHSPRPVWQGASAAATRRCSPWSRGRGR